MLNRLRRRRSDEVAGWLHLGTSVVGLWFTKQALRPVKLPKIRAIPSFFAGWLTNELAFHHLLWQGLSAAVFARLGSLRTAAGRLALVLAAVQTLGLGVLIRRLFAARDAVQTALDEALADFDVPPEEVDAETYGVRWSQIAFPFPIRHPGAVRQRGVTFSHAAGIDLQLDVYRRKDRPERRPVLLYVHGGAWMISNRNEQGLPLMQEMAARGWTGVNADYRLSPWATFPDHIVDVKRAIAWIREHADEIGADPGFIAIAGGSAGGHLAALAAVTGNDPRYQPGFVEADTCVQACVPIYGIYDFLDRENHHGHDRFVDMLAKHVLKSQPTDDPDLWEMASPLDQLTADAPPFFIVHGSDDTLVPVAGARVFAQRLRDISKSPVGFAELPGTQHAFDVFPSLRTAYVIDAVGKFLARAYADWRTVHDTAPAGAPANAAGDEEG